MNWHRAHATKDTSETDSASEDLLDGARHGGVELVKAARNRALLPRAARGAPFTDCLWWAQVFTPPAPPANAVPRRVSKTALPQNFSSHCYPQATSPVATIARRRSVVDKCNSFRVPKAITRSSRSGSEGLCGDLIPHLESDGSSVR